MNSIGGSVINCVSKPSNFGMSCMHVVLWNDDCKTDSDMHVVLRINHYNADSNWCVFV